MEWIYTWKYFCSKAKEVYEIKLWTLLMFRENFSSVRRTAYPTSDDRKLLLAYQKQREE
jgi:hypothetical protein